jgi:hypothetical protein
MPDPGRDVQRADRQLWRGWVIVLPVAASHVQRYPDPKICREDDPERDEEPSRRAAVAERSHLAFRCDCMGERYAIELHASAVRASAT